MTAHGQGGNDALWVNDWFNVLPTVYTVTNTAVTRGAAVVSYGNTVELLRVNEGQGSNVVNVRSTSADTAVAVSLKAGGADTVNVGSVGNSLDAILGPVSVAGEIGQDGTVVDSLNINDQGDGSANTYTLAVGYFERPDYAFPLVAGTISRNGAALISYYNGFTGLTVNAGVNNDIIHVKSTAALAPVRINAGAGDDTITVGHDGSVGAIRGPLAVNGQGGLDRLSIDDSADGPDAFLITPVTVMRNGVHLLTHTGIEVFEVLP